MDRSVVSVESDDSDSDLPVIDEVLLSSTTKAVADDNDAFSKSPDELRLTGTGASFKRKVTNKLKKSRQGVDGTGTKQVADKTFYSGYDAFEVVEPPYNLDNLARLYVASAPHYAAVNAKVANIVGLGWSLKENAKSKRNLEKVDDDDEKRKKVRRKLNEHREDIIEMIEDLNEEEPFSEVLSRVWRDYETMGNGYLEVGRRRDGTIGYLGHVPAQTIRVRRQRDGFVQVSGFETSFFANFGHADDGNPLGGDVPNEIMHIKKHNPISDYYGIPDIVAASQAVAGNEFANRFNLDYFENKAVPRHVIILKGAKLGSQAEQRLVSFFETSLKGVNHRTLYIPLPASTNENPVELKIEPVEAGIQDASFTKYRHGNLSDILMAHRVPLTKISVAEGAALAVARDADKTFKEQVCAPEQKPMEKKVNRIVKELTDAFDFKLNEMTLTDENTQSQIDERRRKTGVETANEQRGKRGEPSIEGGDELFDMNGKAKEVSGTTNRQRDSERSAGATDSVGEARNPKGSGRSDGTA